MSDYPSLVAQATSWVREQFARHPDASLHYHDLAHTEYVVRAVQEMAKAYNLPEEERSILILAAWFHDVGYLKEYNDHVATSITMARAFLQQHSTTDQFTEQVIRCIQATEWPQQPDGQLQEILCDADMSHLAVDDYLTRAQDLRKEIEEHSDQKLGRKKWTQANQQFYKEHHYFTDYAQKHYQPKKEKNYQQLVEQVKKDQKEKKVKKAKEISSREAGVLYRIIFRNHIDLSSIADTKANIMISVNSILLSVLVTVLFRNLDDYPNLWLPSTILATVCLLAIVFAVLATLPRVTQGTFRKEDVKQNKVNLLFFGNFHRMSHEDFQWGMRQVIKNDTLVYDSLTLDLYLLGKVLHQKYTMLRKAYLTFVIGWVVSIIAFVLTAFYDARVL